MGRGPSGRTPTATAFQTSGPAALRRPRPQASWRACSLNRGASALAAPRCGTASPSASLAKDHPRFQPGDPLRGGGRPPGRQPHRDGWSPTSPANTSVISTSAVAGTLMGGALFWLAAPHLRQEEAEGPSTRSRLRATSATSRPPPSSWVRRLRPRDLSHLPSPFERRGEGAYLGARRPSRRLWPLPRLHEHLQDPPDQDLGKVL